MNLNNPIIGLTGRYCSGKNAAAKILQKECGYRIIDVDAIGHDALEKKKSSVVKAFGNVIRNGKVDRKKLGNIVFRDGSSLKKLNSIVHPLMVSEIKSLLKRLKNKKVCINAALLLEMGLHEYCDRIIIIRAGLPQLLRRAKKRDKRSVFAALSILWRQKALKRVKNFSINADISYIDNNKEINDLKEKLITVIKRGDTNERAKT